MTPEQIRLVQETYRKLLPVKEEAASQFYTRLFAIDPEIRSLFGSDMAAQGEKFMAMLGTVADGLNRPEAIVPTVQALGRRHVGYGVSDDQFVSVVHALLWMLAESLGDAFTDAVRDAWIEVYEFLAGIMTQAMAEERANPGGFASPAQNAVPTGSSVEVDCAEGSIVNVDEMRVEIEELRNEIDRVGSVAEGIGAIAK